jgi:putative NADH-flavin reductase
MKLAVFGATGQVGRRVVDEALGRGDQVVALIRTAGKVVERPGLTTVIGELTDGDAVARTVSGVEGVIWAVGPTSNRPDQPDLFETAARLLVETMERLGVRRLVALSGAAVTHGDERKPRAGRSASALVRVLVRHVVEAKRREYGLFAGSHLEWTLVRPPRVIEGPVTGRSVKGNKLQGRTVTVGDLAQFMAAAVHSGEFVRAAPYISSPSQPA